MDSAPSHWGAGLQVLPEKMPGISLVKKLQAILLMEGGFIFFNKWIFGQDAINRLYKLQYVPDDQYSQKESTAEDSKFVNRLTMDLLRQFSQVLVAISADADKCYGHINHITVSLLLCAIVGSTGAVDAMLIPIQTMKFYQCTGRGDSNTYMGGRTTSNPLQSLCQGNGATPACWLMKISTILACYKKAGFGSSIIAPIRGEVIIFMGEIYVEDTNMLVILPDVFCKTLISEAQQSLNAWAHLFNATGGVLNPAKCYWYVVDYKCIKGVWTYEHRSNFNLSIPLPDGLQVTIQQTHTDKAKKMLGYGSLCQGTTHVIWKNAFSQKPKPGSEESRTAHFQHTWYGELTDMNYGRRYNTALAC
jgi:hypothetical protein